MSQEPRVRNGIEAVFHFWEIGDDTGCGAVDGQRHGVEEDRKPLLVDELLFVEGSRGGLWG